MSAQTPIVNDGSINAGNQRPVRIHQLANRNFRLLWIGENISLLGDQFYLVALPWLVFRLTDSSLMFGAILLIAGIPRALLMLIGGVVTDRFSPRRIMITSNLLRFCIVVLVLFLVATQQVELWALFIIAFCFGLVDAFFYPAYRAILPLIVAEDHLQTSNALMQGTSQLVYIVGPGAAGIIVARLGLVFAFAIDAFTFLFTSLALFLMSPTRAVRDAVERGEVQANRHLWSDIREVLAYVRQDRLLSILLGVVAAINLLFTGPFTVGSAALSRIRFVEGSTAYGAMLSAFSIGILIGTVTAGLVHLKNPGKISLLLVASQGVFMTVIAVTQSLVLACGLWMFIGCTAGFGSINFITLTQKRVNKSMLGRYMSLIALSEVGLAPISNAFAGIVAEWNVTALFVGAGLLLSVAALLALTNRVVRQGE